MRERLYPFAFLLTAGLLLYFGRSLLQVSDVMTWGLTFAGTTAAGVLGMALYRVQLELRASRHELALRQAELNFALEVQRALFPRQFPSDVDLEFTGICVPARGISGDFYDVMQLPDGRLVFAIADISGKGISAAILMTNLQAVLRMLATAVHLTRSVPSLISTCIRLAMATGSLPFSTPSGTLPNAACVMLTPATMLPSWSGLLPLPDSPRAPRP